jgi:hypothetical protein
MLTTFRASSRCLALGAALLTSLASSVALAEQVVVFDQTWEHTADLPDSHFRMPPSAETPADWVSPIDYSQGSAWVYLEVHTKPTDQETKFQVCFEANPTYACTAQSPTYTEVGVYEWETPFADFWSPPGEFVDWTQGTNNVACILKDTVNGKPSADNVGRETAALYTPTEVRLVVTLVEAGAVYEPPTAEGGTSSGTDGGGESSATSDGADETSGTTTGAGADDATVTAADDAPGEDGGATTLTTSEPTTSAADSTETGTGGEDDDATGCACASERSRTTGLWWLGFVAFARRRRAA